ncbi:MAG: transposase [Candidatus Kerfeldbacteria bacterium]
MRPIVEFPIAYFITTVTKDRRRLFSDVRLAYRFATMIRLACQTKGFTLLGFCILPDHAHLLVIRQGILERMPWAQGGEAIDFSLLNVDATFSRAPLETARRKARKGGERLSSPHTKGALSRAPGSLGDLMRSMKGTFSRAMMSGHVWQRRYHLRHVVNGEDLLNVVNYIQYNYRKHDMSESYGREPYVWLNKSILKRML